MTITSEPNVASNDLQATREQVLAAVDAILPILERNAQRGEAERSIPKESFDALVESGALRLFVPRRFGGLEAGYRTFVEVTAKVAGACGASAWFCFILNHGDWHVGQMSQAVQEKVWADGPGSKAIVPLSPAPGYVGKRVEGGTVINGEWPYSSGSDHAKWGVLGFPVIGEDGIPTDTAIGLVSLDDAEIKDTWHVAGLAATSSNTVVMRDVLVPDDWTITMSELLSHNFRTSHPEESQYQMDAGAVFHVATLPPVLGFAKKAFDLTRERITKSTKPMTYTYYADTAKSPATQAAMARAWWLIETAFEQTLATADAIDAQAATGLPFSSLERTQFAMRAAQGHRMCREAMDLILDVGGAGSFALGNPLQRLWRDLNVASRHGMSVPGLKEEAFGKALLGADEQQMTPIV